MPSSPRLRVYAKIDRFRRMNMYRHELLIIFEGPVVVVGAPRALSRTVMSSVNITSPPADTPVTIPLSDSTSTVPLSNTHMLFKSVCAIGIGTPSAARFELARGKFHRELVCDRRPLDAPNKK